jgi:hypothetical protein
MEKKVRYKHLAFQLVLKILIRIEDKKYVVCETYLVCHFIIHRRMYDMCLIEVKA